MSKVYKLDPKLVESCYKHYSLACEELEKIEKMIKEYAHELGLELSYRDDTFEPFWVLPKDPERLMSYPVFKRENHEHGHIYVMKDGTLAYEKESQGKSF